jgi:hypothetical protein
MLTRLALLLICLRSFVGQVSVSTQSTDDLDEAAVAQMALVTDSESSTLDEAYVGDRRGDVVRLTTCPLMGIPVVLTDGTLMTWSNAKDGETQIARAAFSKDNGLTWTEPKDLFEFPAGTAQWNGQSSFVDKQGNIHLFGLEYYHFDHKNWLNSKSHLWHARSTDGGTTWDPVQKIESGHQYVGCAMNAFQTKSGRILAPVSCMSTRKIGAFISVCPYSDDYGATWKAPTHQITTNTGAKDWYESGNAEPVGVQLNDGRVWIVMRSQDGFQWETFSNDDGVTWSDAQHTRFVSNQSQMTVFRMKDGRLLLLWNNCGADPLPPVEWYWAERTVVAAAISDDEGKTWKGYREIARAVKPGVEICNPHVVEMSNGRLLVFVGGELLSIDPDFLTNTDFVEVFDRGVRRWSMLPSEGVSVVADPDGGSGRVLKMVKPKADVTAAACLNIPFGRKGTVRMRVRIEPEFQGAHITLSDHYDLPGLARDASFPFRINEQGRVLVNGSGGSWLPSPGDLTPGNWHELELTWDCTNHEALLKLDGVEIGRLRQYVFTDGVCYLRVRSTAATIDDAGLYLKSVAGTAVP